MLKALPLTFAFAETTSLEMTPKGVSKGSGLTILAKHLGVDLEAVIAVGDADNDREMLETAGLAVAMGNAIDSIKTIADVITAPHRW